jgi:hypothetical protein
MDAATTDLLFTLLASGSLLTLAGAAVMALPWSETEFVASARAWRSLGALPGALCRVAGGEIRSRASRAMGPRPLRVR